MNNIPLTFPITVFENAGEKVSDTITKKRVSIFYKGYNRNGGYIDDDFAEKLIKTLPYAPIKGIYDKDEEDFTDHGKERTEGRIYGVVPENLNFAWEDHEDEDGVTRTYACADVYLFTALYPEANKIAGKGQSMELYKPSIQGQWFNLNGKQAYKYTDACFLGLQVLGDQTTPCFEGASFFSLNEEKMFSIFAALLEKIETLTGGNEKMEENTLTFALSDSQKQNAIFKALNPEKIQFFVMETYDSYAIVYDLENEGLKKVNFTKNEDDTITVDETLVDVTAEYVTADEAEALRALRGKGETYAAIVENFDALANNVSDLEAIISDKDVEISTLNTDKETLNNTIENLNNSVATYEAQISDLIGYKNSVETAKKEAVIAKYSEKLPEEILSKYSINLSEYTVETLKRDLAYELVENAPGLFSVHKDNDPCYVPQEAQLSGLEALLSKYN